MTELRKFILDTPSIVKNFSLGPGTETYFGCSSILKGETYVFGGKREHNQVGQSSQVEFFLFDTIITF